MKKQIIILSLIYLFSGSISELKAQSKPNIIYILADDLGYGDLSSFNEKSKIKTPNIDQLASEGMKFTDAHTSSSVCSPTRYGILTGRYNWRTRLKEGVLNGTSKALIPNSRTTVASMLKNNGYQTAFIGKWHLGWDWDLKNPITDESLENENFEAIDFSKPVKNNPNDIGFTYSYGFSGSLDMAPYVYVENRMATQIPISSSENTDKYAYWRKGPISSDFIHVEATPNFIGRAIKYLGEKGKEKKPFFMYLALPSPHTPILPAEQWQGKSGLNPYGDFVMMLDNYIGQLMKAIKATGIEENTLIIFTSDNGCSPSANYKILAEKGHNPSAIYRGYKADIFEGGHRVPFIAKWPNKIKKGSVSNETICTTDLLATCADIIKYNLKADEGEDSYSLVPLFGTKKLDKPLREATVHHSMNGSFAIRKGDWKLIMSPDSGGWSYPRPKRDQKIIDTLPSIQLYNLKDDPSETNNLQANQAEKVNELKSLLIKYINDGRSTLGEPQKNDSINFKWTQIDFIHQ